MNSKNRALPSGSSDEQHEMKYQKQKDEPELNLAQALIVAQQYRINSMEEEIKHLQKKLASGYNGFDALHHLLDQQDQKFGRCKICKTWTLCKSEEPDGYHCNECKDEIWLCDNCSDKNFCAYNWICFRHFAELCQPDCPGMHNQEN